MPLNQNSASGSIKASNSNDFVEYVGRAFPDQRHRPLA